MHTLSGVGLWWQLRPDAGLLQGHIRLARVRHGNDAVPGAPALGSAIECVVVPTGPVPSLATIRLR